jgi:hypothetical protein
MPPWLAAIVPPLYSQENTPDPIIHARYFDPTGEFTWYVLEYSERAPDGAERLCFGWVDGFDMELGYFSIAELESTPVRLGLRIERDLYFTPCPVSKVIRDSPLEPDHTDQE